ncbi:MAG: hypothetical protein EXS52_02265 [Candidatus Staskawiczbacteria bacterium]|nr:hypothetical protein [Candidatus Staskawiczbacteria bacterium]
MEKNIKKSLLLVGIGVGLYLIGAVFSVSNGTLSLILKACAVVLIVGGLFAFEILSYFKKPK